MLNFVARIPGEEKDSRLTSRLVKTRTGDKAAGLQKTYTVHVQVDGVEAGHVAFKAKARPGTVKGIKTDAVEFDNILFEEKFKGKKLAYVLIWAAAFEAVRKGYREGNVKSIMTVGSYATFNGAGFPAIVGIGKGDKEKIAVLEANIAKPKEEQIVPYKTDDDLRALSGDVSLAIVMGTCEARIMANTGSMPAAT